MERLLDYIKNNVCWEMGAISTEMWEEGSIPGKYYFSIFNEFRCCQEGIKEGLPHVPYPS